MVFVEMPNSETFTWVVKYHVANIKPLATITPSQMKNTKSFPNKIKTEEFKNNLIVSNFERYKNNIAPLDNLLATDPKNTIAIRQAATKAGFNTTVVGIGDSENPQNFQWCESFSL